MRYCDLGPDLSSPTLAVKSEFDCVKSLVLWDCSHAQISITESQALSIFIVTNQIKLIQYKSDISQLKCSPMKIPVTLTKRN